MRFDPKKMTFSAFERYVRIVETVRESDEHLTAGDRMALITELLESHGNPSEDYINKRCKEMYEMTIEYNLASQNWLRRAGL